MKKLFSISAILTLILSVAACSSDEVVGNDDLKPIPQEYSKVEQTPFAQQSNKFANKLLTVLSSQPEYAGKNVCVAPISMQYMLSMAANGATEALRAEMVGAMGFDDLGQLNTNNLALLNKLSQSDGYVKVTLDNATWIDQGFPYQYRFKETIQQYYKAQMSVVDFRANPTEAKQQIDQWAQKCTDGLITSVPLEVEKAHLVMANANCFDGKWANPFDPSYTERSPFYNIDGTESTPKTMENYLGCLQYSDDSLQMVELPYGKGYYSMMLVMPHKTELLDSIAENADWWGWHKQMTEHYTKVSLPRFSITSGWDKVLDMMADLGMPHVKDGVFPYIGGTAKILFLKMVHNVALNVDENGTKVAAVSAGSAMDGAATRPYIHAFDHPFIFAIRENTTGAILFMGKVVKL